MVCIANLQYGWTQFVKPLQGLYGKEHATGIAQAFSFFVLCQTFVVPFNGWIADRIGPKPLTFLAGILIAVGWIIDAHAPTVGILQLGEIVNGLGAGIVYGTMVGVAVKWFPDKRGLAVGLTAAGFGAGTALTVIPISRALPPDALGHVSGASISAAFQTFGVVQGAIVFVIAALLLFPTEAEIGAHLPTDAGASRQRKRSYMTREMFLSPAFYLLYVMMFMIAAGLLFITAQVSTLGGDYGIAKAIVLTTLVVDNLTNGGSRILFGWVSDRIGREATMAIAFTCEALGLLGLLFAANNPPLFLVCCAATFLASGEIYSLFPAACTDLFGPKFATTNSGWLYTAKGVASFVVPIGVAVHAATGSWATILGILVAFNVIVAALALGVLRPLRERAVAAEGRTAPAVGGATATAH
jgi:OFA family oxalate/formate antiporter-like MFS transporter